MAIASGSQLGPYEILSPLGAGGMGEVYEANDTRLDRTVAIKVLPEHLSSDAERRERFEREARAVSSLNHPHICTLHDVGEHDGIHFLVMELVEGESLADRLKKGALPFEQAIDCAAQIADALDKAHRAGIVHRDLKPGNVMLTRTGVKLLDFGLAKTREENIVGEGSEQPTRNKPLTGEGTILGTVQYMAPEQLEGKDVDARADLFALGAVLYEMLTGRKAFEGESQASLISAIMSADPPPVSELQAMSPPALDRLVKKCLAKDPEERWHGARDLVTALRWSTESTSAPTAPARAKWVAALVVPSLILGGAATWFATRDTAPRVGEPRRFDIALASDEPLRSDKPALTLSADGAHIAYATTRQLYLRSTDAIEATPIPSSDDACCPFFSPDGGWLAFFTTSELKKVPIEGGTPVSVAAVANGRWATWTSSGDIVLTRASDPRIYRVPASGGTLEDFVPPVDGATEAGHPTVLSGNGVLVHSILASGNEADGLLSAIMVRSLATATEKRLDLVGSNPHYAPTGHLLYGQQGTLSALPFDWNRLEPMGDPFVVAEGLQSFRNEMEYSVSEEGTLLYAPEGATARMVWVDRQGRAELATEIRDLFRDPRLSPNGSRIAVSTHPSGRSHDVWIYDVVRGTRTRLTSRSHSTLPVWTPDGTRITFASRAQGPGDLFWRPVDASEEETPLLVIETSQQFPSSWHPDGTVVAFETRVPGTNRDIYLFPPNGEQKPWLATPADEFSARFSPDGRFVAYVSDETGRDEVFVGGYPELGARTPISTNGGREPTRSRDGRELFYRSLDGATMYAVSVRTDAGFSAGTPAALFEGDYFLHPVNGPAYDVSADGQRFLMIQEERGTTKLHVVLNWFEELKRLDPNAKR